MVKINITKNIVDKAITDTFTAQSKPGEFFKAKFHRCLQNEIVKLLKNSGVDVLKKRIKVINTKSAQRTELNVLPGIVLKNYFGHSFDYKFPDYTIDYCLRQYPHDTTHPAFYNALESFLEYKQANDKCFGNMAFALKKGISTPLEFNCEFPLKIIGYCNDIGLKKIKPFAAIVGIFVDYNYLTVIGDRFANNCNCSASLLTEEIEEYTAHIPIFQCQCCGKLYCCTCFEDYYKNLKTVNTFIAGYAPLYEHKQIYFKENICQLCSSKKYPTKLPHLYYDLIHFKHPHLTTPLEIKNYLREKYGEPPRATGYKGESLLYEVIAGIIGKDKIIIHYRPEWLQGLEIDIYIPHLKIGFEYQGRQHYEPIKFFGGKDALEDLQYRDAAKKELCKLNNVDLYEYRYDEEIYPDDILKIIKSKT